ncbi:hypothetical protein JRQ81_007078 [Phrynocephalus forsythii]|uniref:Mitochondrial transcription rescue factor 1 C-terminal domain-containing protein n=1 Tax=Phrynocephalus forsythii TaxID=171643 RepID=A0A9Q0Y4H5_9SAUR|nr:hypothetical protein JRQ81_007078 [Phrynocephalus forsythii]
MTGGRLPLGAVRNLSLWLGLLEKSPYRLCGPWKRVICSASYQPGTATAHKYISLPPIKYYVFLIPLPQNVLRIFVRLKSDKKSHKHMKQTVQEESEEEDEKEEEGNSSEEEFEDDSAAVKDYKDLEKAVTSFRFDMIMKAGLDIARHKVEDAFYNGALRLNGEKLWKKSRAVKVGDTLDLIIGEDKETETAVVMRIVLKKASEKNENDKYNVVLRRWKSLKVPKQDVFK